LPLPKPGRKTDKNTSKITKKTGKDKENQNENKQKRPTAFETGAWSGDVLEPIVARILTGGPERPSNGHRGKLRHRRYSPSESFAAAAGTRERCCESNGGLSEAAKPCHGARNARRTRRSTDRRPSLCENSGWAKRGGFQSGWAAEYAPRAGRENRTWRRGGGPVSSSSCGNQDWKNRLGINAVGGEPVGS